MATVTLRSVKGSALTISEADTNIDNLNTDKIELTDISVTQNSASGNGTLSYNNTTGVFDYTPPSIPAAGIANVVEDTTPQLGGDLDAQSNNITSLGTLNTHTIPGGTGTFALTSDITFTDVVDDTTPQLGGDLDCQGNTISNPVLEDYAETIHSLGSTDTPTITISNGNVQSVTISAGLTLPAFSDAATGQSVTLIVSGSGTASGTAAYKFAGGNTTLTTLSVVSIFYDGTNYFASIATDFQ
jgi:hypothetical protein